MKLRCNKCMLLHWALPFLYSQQSLACLNAAWKSCYVPEATLLRCAFTGDARLCWHIVRWMLGAEPWLQIWQLLLAIEVSRKPGSIFPPFLNSHLHENNNKYMYIFSLFPHAVSKPGCKSTAKCCRAQWGCQLQHGSNSFWHFTQLYWKQQHGESVSRNALWSPTFSIRCVL